MVVLAVGHPPPREADSGKPQEKRIVTVGEHLGLECKLHTGAFYELGEAEVVRADKSLVYCILALTGLIMAVSPYIGERHRGLG